MVATTNQLDVKFDRTNVDTHYDFFKLTTSELYIAGGSYSIDKPNVELKALSVAFETGKTMYVMFRKNSISLMNFVKAINDSKLAINKVSSEQIQDYVLFRLFLYSLNNFESEDLSYNNITGKLYLYSAEWMKTNKSSFLALCIDVDAEMFLTAEATTFAKYSEFTESPKLKQHAKYELANKNNTLRRVTSNSTTGDVYIKKGIYNKKAEMPFMTLWKDEIKKCKAYYIFVVLDLLKHRYDQFFTFEFKQVEFNQTIGRANDEKFLDVAFAQFKKRPLAFVNKVVGNEFAEEFEDLVLSINNATQYNGVICDDILDEANNIVLIHNKEYYAHHSYNDVYKQLSRNAVVQCITVEDTAEKIIDDKKAIIDSIVKEIVIKNDILNTHKFSLDNWSAFGFNGDFVFGKEKDGQHYFMIVHPDGTFEFRHKTNDFMSFGVQSLDEASDYLTDNRGKEKTIVIDFDGNINVISRTSRFILPSQKIFSLETISRGAQARKEYLAGVVDINLFEINDVMFYNVGLQGYGMNTKIVHAPILYRVDVVQGKNIVPQLLKTMSVQFVKYKSFTVLPYPIKYLNEYILMQSE